MAPYEGVVVAGTGETKYHKSLTHTPMYYVTESMRLAAADAGVELSEIDGIAASGMEPDNVATVAEHMGLSLRWAYQGEFGNATPIISLLEAARAIQNGDAETVMVVAAGAFDVRTHHEGLVGFNKPMRDYVLSYGFGGENGYFALVERRHRHEYGTTREQLGKMAVTQRRHAMQNENALLREELTLSDYLNARVIADPIRLYDCVMPCGGGDAVILTTDDRAKSLNVPPVRLRAGGQHHNHEPNSVVALDYGWRQFADDMFNQAGIGREDIDLIQLYDDYPIMNLIQFEDLGFCFKGEGGAFVDRMNLSTHGDLPLNTGGGQLSVGQAGSAGGLLGTVEAVRQLTRRAGRRQVDNPQWALTSGFGMTAYGKGLSTASAIFEAPSNDWRDSK